MARDLNLLEDNFLLLVKELLNNCKAMGVIMTPFYTVRTPQEQAKLWRQSRPYETIIKMIRWLRKNGANYLADCIELAGPQHGRWATNAIPGLSWHQWGEAVDCFWNADNEAIWSTRKKINGVNGYKVYAEQARKLGLKPGIDFNDGVHIQKRQESSPSTRIDPLYTIKEIDTIMNEKFSSKSCPV